MGDSRPDNSNSAYPAPPTARPPRFRWLKRLTVVFAIFIGAVVLFDIWWTYEADRRFQAAIDASHARGEPAAPEDFDVSGVPDTENAALSLSNAAKPLGSGNPADVFLDAHGADFTDAWRGSIVQRIIASNATSLQLARLARSQPGVDWKIKMRSPVMSSTVFPHLNPQRELSELLKVSVRYHHAIGDDREAVETIRDMLNESHVVARGPSVLVVHLVSIGLEAMACNAVEQVAPDLQIGSGGATTMRVATRQQVLGLIADLSDDMEFVHDARRGWQGERMQVLDTTRTTSPFSPFSLSNLPFWPKPAFELDGVRCAGNMDRCAAASSQPNWPAARLMLPPTHPSDESQLEAFSTMLSGILEGAVSRAVEQDFRALVDRRGSALRLAIRLYQIDHAGAFPNALTELVPNYLPAVPIDPYAADGRAMSYRAGAPFPALWSVGSNGVDDGGTSLPNDPGQSSKPPFARWDCADIVYPLERIVPATQPSPETQNSQ